jgi:hypothetical protein
MPGTPKQERFFQAIAHGWKPRNKDAPSREVAKKWVADIPKERDKFPTMSAYLKKGNK